MNEDRSLLGLVAAFIVATLVFLGSTLVREVRSTRIDDASEQTRGNSLPSVEALAAARATLRHLDVEAERFADARDDGVPPAPAPLASARAQLDRELAVWRATPEYPGEHELELANHDALVSLDASLAHLRDEPAGLARDAYEAAYENVHTQIDAADDTIARLFALNAAHAYEEIDRVGAVRRQATRTAIGLDTLSVAVTFAAAAVAIHALRKRRAAERRYEEALAERANELESFARRVAHDLLNPLAALGFTVASIRRRAGKGQDVGDLVVRAESCLKRSRRLVDDALDFARSGAMPHAGSVADLAAAIAGVVDEARADESDEGPAEIVVEPFDDVHVACAPGVLASVLGNLVRNATKYSEGSPARRITLRASRVGERAHVEVADTGPGLPPGMEGSVFDAYVRGPDNPKPGLGLGLATVRRFVEAHRGRVGVDSTPGRGAAFWFELPLADAARSASPLPASETPSHEHRENTIRPLVDDPGRAP